MCMNSAHKMIRNPNRRIDMLTSIRDKDIFQRIEDYYNIAKEWQSKS